MPNKQGHIFLSYDRKDAEPAQALERALENLDLKVWRDTRSIAPGTKWLEEIERGIRDARGVVVLVTSASVSSDWVMYEYAFAAGAQIPIVAVIQGKVDLPAPLKGFQLTPYSGSANTAKQILAGFTEQARNVTRTRVLTPKLFAKFQEKDGSPCRDGESFWMDLWIDDAPRETVSVSFEIMDLGFDDRTWTLLRSNRRSSELRQFLTDDMSSYVNVDVWARGNGRGRGTWLTKSSLYDALVRYHGGRPTDKEVQRALEQIRKY